MRRPHRIVTHQEMRGKIPDAVSIRERPAEAEDRAVPGHWEGGLISGSKNSHIVTLVERHSRFTALIKVSDRETATVVSALTKQIRRLPASLRRSLTWDRGNEKNQSIGPRNPVHRRSAHMDTYERREGPSPRRHPSAADRRGDREAP